MNIRAVVIGAGGYAGAELVTLLLDHPQAQAVGLFGSIRLNGAPVRFADLFPRHRGRTDLVLRETDLHEVLELDPDVVLLATPAEVSHDLAPPLVDEGVVVLDLSGAFRLATPADVHAHYGFAHEHPALLARAVYGLPELHREAIRHADLVALPGCYPTSAVLPLAPLVAAGAVDGRSPVIVDSISGVSGAGRGAALETSFCEVSVRPYKVGSHRHAPEIARHAGTPVIFTPHVGPFDRGILSTIHVPLAGGLDEADVRHMLSSAYGGEPFVRLLDAGQWPSVAGVRGTNVCDVGLRVDGPARHLVLASAIDNLLKGAAGQAVQCMNLRFGAPETAGLPGAVLEETPCPAG